MKLSKIRVEMSQKTYQNLLNILNSLKEVIILKRRSVFEKKFNQNIRANVLAGALVDNPIVSDDLHSRNVKY